MDKQQLINNIPAFPSHSLTTNQLINPQANEQESPPPQTFLHNNSTNYSKADSQVSFSYTTNNQSSNS